MNEICWDQLVSFEGYGSKHPKVVFIGYEERGPKALDDQLRNVRARCEQMKQRPGRRGDKDVWHTGPNSLEWRDDHDPLVPGRVTVWNMASRILAELAKHDRDVSAVQQSFSASSWQDEYLMLGTDEGTTLLTEYLPFPSPSNGAFKGTILEQRFDSYSHMVGGVKQQRLAMLKRVISDPSVRYVFMYGAKFDGLWLPIAGPIRNWKPEPMNGRTAMIACHKGKVFTRTGFYGGQATDKLQIPEVPRLVGQVYEARLACS